MLNILDRQHLKKLTSVYQKKNDLFYYHNYLLTFNTNMKPLFYIGIGLVLIALLLTTTHAVGIAGQRRDGTIDPTFVTRSVTSKTIILDCGQGRMRSVKNYTTKCVQKTKGRLRNTRARKSIILTKQAPRYRVTSKPTIRRSTKRTISIEAQRAVYWRNFWKARNK